MNDKLDVLDEQQAKPFFFFFFFFISKFTFEFINIYSMIYVGATKCH